MRKECQSNLNNEETSKANQEYRTYRSNFQQHWPIQVHPCSFRDQSHCHRQDSHLPNDVITHIQVHPLFYHSFEIRPMLFNINESCTCCKIISKTRKLFPMHRLSVLRRIPCPHPLLHTLFLLHNQILLTLLSRFRIFEA